MKDEQGAGDTSSGDSAPHAATDSSFTSRPSALPPGRPTWAEINLDHLAHNFRLIRQTIGAGVAVMPALKADAYGHGATACADSAAALAYPEARGNLVRPGGVLYGLWRDVVNPQAPGSTGEQCYRLGRASYI